MKPPPPRLPASGCTTANANPTATAASTALPPWRRMSRPTALASGCPDTTIADSAVVTRARLSYFQSGAIPAGGVGAGVVQAEATSHSAGSEVMGTRMEISVYEGRPELPRAMDAV